MISVANAQFPKLVVDVMNFVEMKPIPPQEMRKKAYWCTKGA
jgi:hypothetical protein